jgi:ketosteroid isomerase-like protein
MSEDVAQIRTLIEKWAKAVHIGDLDGVLADHAIDIVMFDVPPPEDGVRGIQAYRETWPGFFEWQREGAVFEIVHSTSSQVMTSPTPTLCFAAVRPKN